MKAPNDILAALVKNIEVDELFATFPRSRPPLPIKYQEIYEREYLLNREGEKTIESLAKGVEAWMHRKVAGRTSKTTLEIGAGTLNHLKFEKQIVHYDAVEPFRSLYKDKLEVHQVNEIYATLDQIPSEQRYDRIISVAVLEHMTNLPKETAQAALHLSPNGVFQAGIPSEGGLMWWLGWRMTTGLSYWMRNRLDYGVLMRHEHVCQATEIITVVKALFEDVKVQRFPLPFHHLSLYAYVEAHRPRLELAKHLAQTR